MSKTLQKPRVQRTEKEKLALIEQWEQSGLPILTFCRQHHFSDSVFHSWLNKYRRRKEVKPPNKFIPVQITQPITSREENEALFAEVIGVSGSRIKLYQPVAVDFLRTLMA